MMLQKLPFLIFLIFAVWSCSTKDNTLSLDQEKKAILITLNGETKAALTRDYIEWKTYWVHKDYVRKSYMNFADSSLSESLGWNQIDQFVKTYIEEHPEPAPLPEPLKDIDVRLYENGAWVEYEQQVPDVGLKREMRLMEKVNGMWKIAGMQTVIYAE